ncbi:outer membrane protein assembly factor BamB family protein [Haloarcula sediminis]|uniref:outer membrane protein assembly factor BamB family protein n=1 Tax=Haloarcula sediminis TaxID=3111777 RepID=UPI002D791C6D|nr:hypothetical protein [Haloarcula sp. CK38]
MQRLTRRSALLSSTAIAGALAGCEQLIGAGSSAVEVTSVEVEPARESGDRLAVGSPTTIRATVENSTSSTATEPLTLTVDGTELVTETVTVDAGGSRTWTHDYVFRTAGSLTVAVNGVSEDITVADGLSGEHTSEVRAIAAERESASEGIVRVRIGVENPHDEVVFAAPLVAVDGERASVTSRSDPESGPPVRVPPGETRSLIADRVVNADGRYEATVNGEQVGTAELQYRDTPYHLGTPGRTGPRMPSGGIGTEPTLVAEFDFGEPDRVPDIEELLNVSIRAITDERLYLCIKWRRSDGQIWSIAALDRWSGETAFHLPTTPPGEVAVLGDTEYTLSAESEELMTLTARSKDQTEQWQREFGVAKQRVEGTNMVPADDSLYVTTPDGVAELDADSGETRRTMTGAYPAVGENAVFTFGGEGPLSKFPRDGSTTTPDWQRTPGDGTRETGAVANGRVYVSTFSGDEASEYRYEFHAYDAETGEHQWTTVASQSTATPVGIRLAQLPGMTVRNGYVMWAGGTNIVEADTGDDVETDGIRGGYAGSPLGPRRVYGVDESAFYVSTFLEGLADGERSVPGANAVPLPESLGESRLVDMLYGRGVMYVATRNRVYGYSGTLPDNTE